MTHLKAVISGSFRKHFDEILQVKKKLEELGVQVLSPSCGSIQNKGHPFIILNSDPIHHYKLIQDSFFARLRCSTFMVVVNKNKYIGPACALEIGYAISMGIQIFALEKITDPNIAPYCSPLNEIVEITTTDINI